MPPKQTQQAPQPRATKASTKKKLAPPVTPKAPKRRQARSPPPKADIPIWDQAVISKAARERKRFKLSRASLHEHLNEDYITQQAKKLMGESKNSWGVPETGPIGASRRPKPTSRRARAYGGEGDVAAFTSMFQSIVPQSPDPKENDISRSPILRAPLEVREKIYGSLIVYPTPIMLKSDWTTVERNTFVNHSLMFVCKQFAFEASSFLFRMNTFQVLIREPPTALLRFEVPLKLPTQYHSHFRNIVIDCSKTCWDIEWYEKAAEGLNNLIEAKAAINTMTLVVVPQRVGMSTTAVGMEPSPVTFADFLWYPSAFMKAIIRLAPKTFKVVIKKSGRKKLGIALDLTYLRVGTEMDNILANDDTLELRDARLSSLKAELKNLKDRFEEVFEDDEWALRQGKCSLIPADKGTAADEDVVEGMHADWEGSGSSNASRYWRERSESEERRVY